MQKEKDGGKLNMKYIKGVLWPDWIYLHVKEFHTFQTCVQKSKCLSQLCTLPTLAWEISILKT
jgi:hypothetical protein